MDSKIRPYIVTIHYLPEPRVPSWKDLEVVIHAYTAADAIVQARLQERHLSGCEVIGVRPMSKDD